MARALVRNERQHALSAPARKRSVTHPVPITISGPSRLSGIRDDRLLDARLPNTIGIVVRATQGATAVAVHAHRNGFIEALRRAIARIEQRIVRACFTVVARLGTSTRCAGHDRRIARFARIELPVATGRRAIAVGHGIATKRTTPVAGGASRNGIILTNCAACTAAFYAVRRTRDIVITIARRDACSDKTRSNGRITRLHRVDLAIATQYAASPRTSGTSGLHSPGTAGSRHSRSPRRTRTARRIAARGRISASCKPQDNRR